jgi:hypothetical protein
LPNRIKPWVVAAIILAGLVLWAAACTLKSTFTDPEFAFLYRVGGATWIRVPNPEAPGTYGAAGFRAAFRKRFSVERVPENAVLYFIPFRWITVLLDGEVITRTNANQDIWKFRYGVDLSSRLTPGTHELVFSVRNRAGPPMVLAHCDELGLRTDETWEATNDEVEGWIPAATLDTPQVNSVGSKVPPTREAFLRTLPFLMVPFLLVFAWTVARDRSSRPPWLHRLTPSASSLRWLLLTAWAVLAANNITKVPYQVGFDVNGHLEYMLFIIRNKSIPLAGDGWAMFQSPLYHLVSSPLYVVFSKLLSPVRVVEALRIVPLFCGAMQVQLCYLAVREVFPEREDLQSLGTLLGGLLPMNLYMSQNLGNEPLVGILCSASILVVLKLQRNPSGRWSSRTFVLLGALLGLALLAKLTALLLYAPVALAVAHAAFVRDARPREAILSAAKAMTAVCSVAFAVCGWYYVRNWVLLGKPFIGGWDRARGYEWWQEPGYRTLEQFASFGQALSQPIYSALHGLWDGIYSTLWLDGFLSSQVEVISFPPWNLDLMLSSAWLSLLPTAALLIGAAAIAIRRARAARSGELLALICLGAYFLATAYLMLRIPSFSTIKATYTMGVLPCYAIVAAAGFRPLVSRSPGRAIVNGGMACWAMAAYAAYFVL